MKRGTFHRSAGIKLIFTVIFAVVLLTGCGNSSDCAQTLQEMKAGFAAGNLTAVRDAMGSIEKQCSGDERTYREADSLSDMAGRILLDFVIPEEKALEQILSRYGDFTEEERMQWENKGWLEYRVIDGKKMYFSRAVPNLFLLKKFHEQGDLAEKETAADPEMKDRLEHTTEAVRVSAGHSDPVLPVRVEVRYTITVNPDVVPAGEKIRCWLPWPKSDHMRQQGAELLSTSVPEYIISPDTAVHCSLYMEAAAKKGQATVFSAAYRFRTSAQYFDPDRIKTGPYDTAAGFYRKYTSEQLPQIHFTPEIKRLADSIAGDEKDPLKVAGRIYMWFKENIPWTGALEYSIMTDIPGYVCKNRRGDCGMQTLLYISMLRYRGIPARWQSGWMIPPAHENLHDWCEIWFEGTGWVPSDVSYDLQLSNDEKIRKFFMTGLDSYRMIVNDGISGHLYPGKEYRRSEPYDFQRGEVEWAGGNLYFDKWDYKIELKYLK